MCLTQVLKGIIFNVICDIITHYRRVTCDKKGNILLLCCFVTTLWTCKGVTGNLDFNAPELTNTAVLVMSAHKRAEIL